MALNRTDCRGKFQAVEEGNFLRVNAQRFHSDLPANRGPPRFSAKCPRKNLGHQFFHKPRKKSRTLVREIIDKLGRTRLWNRNLVTEAHAEKPLLAAVEEAKDVAEAVYPVDVRGVGVGGASGDDVGFIEVAPAAVQEGEIIVDHGEDVPDLRCLVL